MTEYLNEQVLKAIERDLDEYSRDYNKLIERSKMIDIQEQDRIPDHVKSFEILNNFGAII